MSPRADRPKRRTFTVEYKAQIVAEYDAAGSGERGAIGPKSKDRCDRAVACGCTLVWEEPVMPPASRVRTGVTNVMSNYAWVAWIKHPSPEALKQAA